MPVLSPQLPTTLCPALSSQEARALADEPSRVRFGLTGKRERVADLAGQALNLFEGAQSHLRFAGPEQTAGPRRTGGVTVVRVPVTEPERTAGPRRTGGVTVVRVRPALIVKTRLSNAAGWVAEVRSGSADPAYADLRRRAGGITVVRVGLTNLREDVAPFARPAVHVRGARSRGRTTGPVVADLFRPAGGNAEPCAPALGVITRGAGVATIATVAANSARGAVHAIGVCSPSAAIGLKRAALGVGVFAADPPHRLAGDARVRGGVARLTKLAWGIARAWGYRPAHPVDAGLADGAAGVAAAGRARLAAVARDRVAAEFPRIVNADRAAAGLAVAAHQPVTAGVGGYASVPAADQARLFAGDTGAGDGITRLARTGAGVVGVAYRIFYAPTILGAGLAGTTACVLATAELAGAADLAIVTADESIGDAASSAALLSLWTRVAAARAVPWIVPADALPITTFLVGAAARAVAALAAFADARGVTACAPAAVAGVGQEVRARAFAAAQRVLRRTPAEYVGTVGALLATILIVEFHVRHALPTAAELVALATDAAATRVAAAYIDELPAPWITIFAIWVVAPALLAAGDLTFETTAIRLGTCLLASARTDPDLDRCFTERYISTRAFTSRDEWHPATDRITTNAPDGGHSPTDS